MPLPSSAEREAIRKEIEDGTGTHYGDLVKAIREAPITYLPALIAVVIEEAVKRKIFLRDGLIKFVERVEHQTQEDHPNGTSPR